MWRLVSYSPRLERLPTRLSTPTCSMITRRLHTSGALTTWGLGPDLIDAQPANDSDLLLDAATTVVLDSANQSIEGTVKLQQSQVASSTLPPSSPLNTCYTLRKEQCSRIYLLPLTPSHSPPSIYTSTLVTLPSSTSITTHLHPADYTRPSASHSWQTTTAMRPPTGLNVKGPSAEPTTTSVWPLPPCTP